MWMMGVLMIYLLVLSICDLKSRSIPVWLLILGGLIAGGVICFREICGGNDWMGLLIALIPGIVMLVLAGITNRTGYGDGCVLLILGCVREEGVVCASFFFSLFLMGIIAVILLALKRVSKKDRLPYIPFLTCAVLFAERVLG